MQAPEFTALIPQIEAWIADDPDEATASELEHLLQQATAIGSQTPAAQAQIDEAQRELADRFSGLLQFGTAGLRGALGGGPARMNRSVVIRAAAGLTNYLLGEVSEPVVVIGYDARHGSAQFATDTAEVVAGAGGHAIMLPGPLPTPVLAYAVLALEADAGVMVTASHNPPQDNGYKVYLGGRVVTDSGQGVQIVPPYDGQIAAEISRVSTVAGIPRTCAGTGRITQLDEGIWNDYIAAIGALATPGPRDLSIVTTALHGVGDSTLQRVLHGAGFTDVTSVPEQSVPDPDFPTVNFPNPEEPGALDLAFATAERTGADVILANDPDADRASAAIPDASDPSGWRQLTGDEIGAILGEFIAVREATALTRGERDSNATAYLARSIVSSRLLDRIAAHHGLGHEATLTGFKWIARTAGLVYGYEEAIGYCVAPDIVRDKDGISAALVLALVAAEAKANGKTLADTLDALAERHGLHATAPLSIRVTDLALIGQGMARLRANPLTQIAGSPVLEWHDLAEGSEGLPPTDGIWIRTAADDRVVVRPSGTEPKLKCYLEVVSSVDGDIAGARVAAAERLNRISDELRTALGI